MLMFTQFNHKQLTLSELSSQLSKRHDVEISKQGVDNRFNQSASEFIKAVLEKALKKAIVEDGLEFLSCFKSSKIKDSTCFQLPKDMASKYPGSGGAGSLSMIRIQFEYDLKTGQITDLSLHAFNDQDNTNSNQTIDTVEPGELIIRDLGYINLAALQQIDKKDAYFLNRLQYAVTVFEKKAEKYVELDFTQIERYLKSTGLGYIEKQVYIGAKEKLPARLIIELLPADVKQNRIRKAQKEAKKKGRSLGAAFKSRSGLNLFITNADQGQIDTKRVRILYSIRWQIELVFKVWKSIGEIDKVKKMKTERFECYLFAKLLWLTVNWQIFWEINLYFHRSKQIFMSLPKMFKAFKEDMDIIRDAIRQGAKTLEAYLVKVIRIAERNYKSEKKKKKLSLLEIISMFK